MCDPISIASAGATAVGTMLSAKDASDNLTSQQNARNAATTAEIGRQKVYGDQARGQFDTALQPFATPGGQAAGITNASSGIKTVLDSNAPTAANVGTITTATAPRVVGDSETSRLGDVFTKAATNRTNLANLKGYDQNFFNNDLALKETGRNIDTIGDFSKTSAGVNKTEQQAAGQNAYKAPGLLGPLFQVAGAAGMAGAGKYGTTLSGRQSTFGYNPLEGAFSFGGNARWPTPM